MWKINWLLPLMIFLCALSISSSAAAAKLGVLLFSEQPRYLEAVRGFMDRLKEAGLGEPQNTFVMENAKGNKAIAAELVKKLRDEKMALIFTVGTHATLAVMQEIKDVPIVFAQVYDPVEAGIAKNWDSSGNNTTGATTKIPMSKLYETLLLFKPVKSMAVLYTPGEKNSEAQLKDLQTLQKDYGVNIVPVPVSKSAEIQQVLPIVLQSADSLYVTGSNLVDSDISTIVAMATKARVPTISHLEDLIEKGVLFGAGCDSYQVGRLAGQKAIQIMQGAKPQAIPIETPPQIKVMLNVTTARTGGFQIPPEFMKRVTTEIH